MSASPAGAPTGRTPNGTSPPNLPLKKRANNPLVPPSRNRGQKPSPFSSRPAAKPNGASHLGPNGAPRATPQPRKATTPQPVLPNDNAEKEEDLGPPTKEFPVFTTKRALLNGIRYHTMRLMARQQEDVCDESSFTRPIRLHRRNPRLQPGDPYAQDGDAEDNDEDPERKLDEQRKAERQAIREANQAQIAPNAKENPKKRDFSKKIEQVYRSHDNLEAKKRSQLRYEETMPWHLEDFDNKNRWVGSYEAHLSETFVVFVPEEERFRMIPVEKWYKFNPKAKYKVLSSEEAEARMAKGVSDPKFLKEAKIRAKEERLRNTKPQRMFLRKGERGERPGRRGDDDDEIGEIVADENDIDFDLREDFQDDEENPLFDDEELEREAARRIAREQKEANVFKDIKEEKDYDAEEEKEKLKKQEWRKREKATRRALRKEKEVDAIFDSDDSDRNPYSDTSDSEDEEERQRLEDETKQKEKEAADKAKAEDTLRSDGKSSKPTSGRGSDANTPKGGTPSARASKHPVSERIASSSSLKRPGSPDLSETDGNEASRKKSKKKHDKLLNPNAPATAPSSRPRSPDIPTDNEQRKRKARPAGSGSDTETDGQRKKPKINRPNAPATAQSSRPMSPEIATDSEGRKRKVRPAGSGSDTETDGQRKKLKINVNKSPEPSRAGSPGALKSAGAAPASSGASRAGSPATTPARPLPTAEQIKAAIPPAGMPMKDLVNKFRYAMTQDKATFINMVKACVRMQKTSSGATMLLPKTA